VKKVLITFFLFLFGVLFLASYSGLFKIPIFSDILYKKKMSDLKVETNPKTAENFIQKLESISAQIKEQSISSNPIVIEVKEEELTSWADEMCEQFPEKCPVSNFQIKFEQNEFKASAHLKEPIQGDVTVIGSISKKNEKEIDLEFKKAYLGNLLLPGLITESLEKRAEHDINEMLRQAENLRIDQIEISQGKALFVGLLPYWLPEESFPAL